MMENKYLVLMLIALLAGCEQPIQPPPPPRPALVMVVGAKASENAMVLVGEVRPRYESNQGFRINGKIIERKVDVGTRVIKGQLLVRLDATDTHLDAAAAQADVRAAEASYALALAEFSRQRQLFSKKFISSSALDIQEEGLKTSKARLAQVKAKANVSGNQTHYTNLTADRDGVITMIHAEPGQVVGAGDVLVKIADLSTIEVLVAVPESRMGEVKLNGAATVRMWANRQKAYSGLVREIAPAADPATRAFDVRITITSADDLVLLGMTAGVKFTPENDQQTAGFLISSSALTEIDGKKTVWVIDENNKAQPRVVVAGQFREDGVIITSGLQAGEKVAIVGVHTLLKDQPVKPVIETEAAQ